MFDRGSGINYTNRRESLNQQSSAACPTERTGRSPVRQIPDEPSSPPRNQRGQSMMTWPIPTMRCECCCRPSDYCFWGPSGWVCIRCDMRGVYDRATYLQREGLAEGSNSIDLRRAFRGILLACFLGALLWALIWWLAN